MNQIEARTAPRTVSEVRAAFKAIGYQVSIRSNPFKASLAELRVTGQGLSKFQIGSATVMAAETFKTHKPMFDLANSIRGLVIGGQKIA